MPSILQTLEKMKVFSARVRSGQFSGQGGTIMMVNIGIGGSDLGPAMVVKALHHITMDQTVILFPMWMGRIFTTYYQN